MQLTMCRVGLLLALVSLAWGCADPAPAGEVLATAQAPATEIAGSEKAASPSSQSRAGQAGGEYSSAAELLGDLSEAERRAVEDFYSRYGNGLLDFTQPEQHRWLVQHGYPMPADVIAAEAMSTDELLRAHRSGNPMAGYFYMARKAQSAEQAKLTLDDAVELDIVASELLANGSPFAGYAYYHHNLAVNKNHLKAYAGLAWALARGDSRALFEMQQGGAGGASAVDSTALLSAFMALQSDVRLRKPALLTQAVTQYPIY